MWTIEMAYIVCLIRCLFPVHFVTCFCWPRGCFKLTFLYAVGTRQLNGAPFARRTVKVDNWLRNWDDGGHVQQVWRQLPGDTGGSQLAEADLEGQQEGGEWGSPLPFLFISFFTFLPFVFPHFLPPGGVPPPPPNQLGGLGSTVSRQIDLVHIRIKNNGSGGNKVVSSIFCTQTSRMPSCCNVYHSIILYIKCLEYLLGISSRKWHLPAGRWVDLLLYTDNAVFNLTLAWLRQTYLFQFWRLRRHVTSSFHCKHVWYSICEALMKITDWHGLRI